MSDADYRRAYACWRWDMWLAGYGTYVEIDRAVSAGRLIPLVRPERQAAELAKRQLRSWWRRLLGWLFGRPGGRP